MKCLDQNQSVGASFLSMLKRLWQLILIYDLAGTFVKSCHDLCNLSAIVIFFSQGEVAGGSQAMLDRSFRDSDWKANSVNPDHEHEV